MKKFIFLVVLLITGPSQAEQSQIASGGPWIGCANKADFKNLEKYSRQKDDEAFQKLYLATILSERCVLLYANESVYITDRSIYSGLTKVRVKGSTSEFWTWKRAVK